LLSKKTHFVDVLLEKVQPVLGNQS
jgi:hypothetical protein